MGKMRGPTIHGLNQLEIKHSFDDDLIRFIIHNLSGDIVYEWRVAGWRELPTLTQFRQISMFKFIEGHRIAEGVLQIRDKVMKECRLFSESDFKELYNLYLAALVKRRKTLVKLESILRACY